MSNRLAAETSPYLLQHANNPVDWHPWDDQALSLAKTEQRPILLSIGYSACHWCHVMAHESFENAAIAAQMNRDFVCIKVDREERPDLDEIYMRAIQGFSGGHGGWPMTVFLTPDGEPFWGGTYFPPQRSGQMPGFDEVMSHAAQMWGENRERVDEITAQMVDYLHRGGRMPIPDERLTDQWLNGVFKASKAAFDQVNGGFGGAPKFPASGVLATLLAHWQITGESESMMMVTATLDGMARGGTYDQLAGGFARYSVDASWTIPHFEKMLYDNAQLIPVYVDAWLATSNPHYRRVVAETVGWLLREMRLESGGFAASTDADSEGVEGKFFVWTPDQITAVLEDDGPRVAALCGVGKEASFEEGTSVLRLEEPLERMDSDDADLLRRSFPKLLAARCLRVAPDRDDKVVTSWNALTISALARAGAAMNEPDWVTAALKAAELLLNTLTVDGRLMRTFKDGRAHVLAYADDHANLISACLDLYEATFDQVWLARANKLADTLVSLFWDDEAGALFYTGSDAGALVTRSKNVSGGAEPSANGSAALAFVRLSKLCGRKDLAKRAEVILKGYQPTLEQVPRALGIEALAGYWLASAGCELGVVGDPDHPDAASLIAVYRSRYTPFAVVAARRVNDTYHLLPWMRGKDAKKGPTAYLCEGRSCRAPTRDAQTLAASLDQLLAPDEQRAKAVRVHGPSWSTDESDWLNTAAPPSLKSLRGQVVVLDFWTYCCINCLHIIPELHAVEDHFSGQPVSVIGVHSAKFDAEKQRDNVRAAISKHKLRHPVLLDPEHKVWSDYTVKSWPTVVVLDVDGRVAWQRSGEWSRETLVEVVEGLLSEARDAGKLAHARPEEPDETEQFGALCFPGKVCVWPSSTVQGLGPAPGCSQLYISDSGHAQVVACSLSAGDDGWPVLEVLRRYDGFVDPQGLSRWDANLYVTDAGSHQLKRIDINTGALTVVAGSGVRGAGVQTADDPLQIDLRSPFDVVVSGEAERHVVLVAMAGSHQIWVYLPDENRFGPLAGSGREDHVDGDFEQAALAQPSGLALHGAYLFFADSETSSIRALDLQERQVATVLGRGLFDFGDVDGPATDARLQHPLDVTAYENTLFVADTYNHKIKAIDLHDGPVARTLAGGEGVLWEPSGIDRWGEYLIVADTNHHRIVAVHRDSGELRVLM